MKKQYLHSHVSSINYKVLVFSEQGEVCIILLSTHSFEENTCIGLITYT